MRTRTAIGIASAIVVAQGAMTWVAIKAWLAIPTRQWPVTSWHIQLGPLSEWVAALFTAFAVAVALWIAGHESRTRRRERADADHAQARLVDVEIDQSAYSQWFYVTIRNYGGSPIISVSVSNAWWAARPDVTWSHPPAEESSAPTVIRILQPERERAGQAAATLTIQFLAADGTLVPRVLEHDAVYEDTYEEIDGTPDVEIHFMDSNGTHWRTGTCIDAERISG
jgi:hypothetical protein